MKRRLLAIIISIALIATLMPTFAFAEVSANCTCNHEFKKVERPATLTKDGYKGYECTKCGKHKDGKKIRHPETFKLSKKTYVYSRQKGYVYKGKARKPKVTIYDSKGKLISSDNYTVKYRNNRNAGTAKAIVTFKNDYKGKKTLKFKIKPVRVRKVDEAGIYPSYEYNGEVQSITAMHVIKSKMPYWFTVEEGKDYDITFDRPFKKIGTYTATIKFKGNFKGTVKNNVDIVPGAVYNTKIVKRSKTKMKVRWDAALGATGYRIYTYSLDKSGEPKLYKTTTKRYCWIPRNIEGWTVYGYKKVNGKIYESIWTPDNSDGPY